MICVDTSVWIDALRNASTPPAAHLASLLDADQVLVPSPVRIEVVNGVPRSASPALVEGFHGVVSAVPAGPEWDRVEAWVAKATAGGQRFGVLDLVIAAVAAGRGVPVWSLDADFRRMAELGFVELYAVP